MMDKILEALITSSHPLSVKRGIVKKVVDAAENSVDQEQCKAMFHLTTRLILIGEDNFQKQVGHQVLDAYARYHRCEFEEFFNKGFILNLLQQGYGSLDKKDIGIIDYIHMGLKLIMSCPSVLEIFSFMHNEVLRLVCERPEPLLCAKLSELLSDFVHCMPKGKSAVLFCQQLVRTISQFQCNATQEEELRGFISQVNKISNLLQSIWKAEPTALLPSLQEVFVIISATDSIFEPSIALASLVQHIPLQMITVLIRSLITDQNVKDVSMTCALCRMIDWLSWPLAQHVETWVIALLKGLASVQKFTILIDVTLRKIERIVPHIIKLVQFLKDEASPASKIFLLQLTELVHCMMYQYSGFPDLYEPILEAIKDLPKPSEEKMKLTLNQSAWTSHSNSLASCLSRLSGKSETGKTGLINLGNTCYMNSVIQALFMATDFRRSVLSLNLNGSRSLMRKLQLLFAFLAHTQRAAFAPQNFFEESKPPWFTPGSQQDCSEYLRFLLDRLHEEEKTCRMLSENSSPTCENSVCDCNAQKHPEEATSLTEPDLARVDGKTLIEKMFGGKLQTTIHCLNCKSTSQKQEAFTDLSLAFPPCLEDIVEAGSTQLLVPAECESRMPTCCTAVVSDTLQTEPSVVHDLQVEEIGHRSEMQDEMLKTFPLQSVNSADSSRVPIQSDELVTVHSNKSIEQNDKTKSVPNLINYFLAPEILNGENKYYCENCASLQNAQKLMQVVDEPEYLILTLLRFSYDSKSHVRRKILDDVALPLTLQLPVEKKTPKSLANSQSLLSDSPENLPKKLKPSGSVDSSDSQSVSYHLCSIVVHSGMSSESGHYYCYARNTNSGSVGQLCYKNGLADLSCPPSYVADNDNSSTSVIWHETNCKETSKEWFLFNDSRVTFTSFQSVQNITNKFPKDTAYVLFYRKQDANDGIYPSTVNGLWVNGEPPLQKELMDAITKDNKLYLQEQELSARTRALQASSTTCSFRPHSFDDSDPPGSCGPSGGGGGSGGFNTISRLVF
ncbi:ubiquitin carboxyl-terminal hydrolase 38 isoform X2 [Hemitrygon akajei]|uniref:ubiquitin carboxyl-terminal hydrolase 38 isoform X2 n=1 Tax=Hemitrygon akajei TaxID=2704970 RepID=UPI003BF94156